MTNIAVKKNEQCHVITVRNNFMILPKKNLAIILKIVTCLQ